MHGEEAQSIQGWPMEWQPQINLPSCTRIPKAVELYTLSAFLYGWIFLWVLMRYDSSYIYFAQRNCMQTFWILTVKSLDFVTVNQSGYLIKFCFHPVGHLLSELRRIHFYIIMVKEAALKCSCFLYQ